MNSMKNKNFVIGLYEKELSLLERLESCLIAERECLIKSNISALGFVKKEKERIFKDISHVQKERKNFLVAMGEPLDNSEKRELKALNSKLNIFRNKVRTHIKQNMDFIQDMLGFFEGLFSSILVRQDESCTYKDMKRVRVGACPKVARTEV